MQGFFVRVSDPKPGDSSATASLQFKNDGIELVIKPNNPYYKTKNKAEIPQIRLNSRIQRREKKADATVIYFRPGRQNRGIWKGTGCSKNVEYSLKCSQFLQPDFQK